MKTKIEYDEIEVELVMDAYGVDRTRALAILREKLKARKEEESRRKTTGTGRSHEVDFDDCFEL